MPSANHKANSKANSKANASANTRIEHDLLGRGAVCIEEENRGYGKWRLAVKDASPVE